MPVHSFSWAPLHTGTASLEEQFHAAFGRPAASSSGSEFGEEVLTVVGFFKVRLVCVLQCTEVIFLLLIHVFHLTTRLDAESLDQLTFRLLVELGQLQGDHLEAISVMVARSGH